MPYGTRFAMDLAIPVEHAWSILTDVCRASSVINPSLPVAREPAGRIDVGTRFHVHAKDGPVFIYEVTTYDAPHHFEYRMTTDPRRYAGSGSLQSTPTERGTHVESRGTASITNRLERYLFPLLIAPFYPLVLIKVARQRKALQRYVESSLDS